MSLKLLTQKYTYKDEVFSVKPIEGYDEVVKIHSVFFSKPKKNKRSVLRLLMKWAIKEYIKTYTK